MTVDFAYQIVQYAANKAQSGYITPAQFNLIINQAQLGYASFLLGTLQKYSQGRSNAPVEFGQNQVVRQRLTPIIYGYILSIDADGFSPYPGDYTQTDAITTIYGYDRVRYVQQDYLYSVLNSTIDPVASNPIYLIEDEGFRFYPNNLLQSRLSYVRIPPNIYWAYTEDVNGIPAYNPALSVDPVWQDVSMLEIIVRALALVGVNLQLGVVSQYADMIKNGGQ